MKILISVLAVFLFTIQEAQGQCSGGSCGGYSGGYGYSYGFSSPSYYGSGGCSGGGCSGGSRFASGCAGGRCGGNGYTHTAEPTYSQHYEQPRYFFEYVHSNNYYYEPPRAEVVEYYANKPVSKLQQIKEYNENQVKEEYPGVVTVLYCPPPSECK